MVVQLIVIYLRMTFMKVGTFSTDFSNENTIPKHDTDWHFLVQGVAANNGMAIVNLYRFLSCSVRPLLYRELNPPDAEDCLHDVLISIVTAIQRGDLRQVSALPAFAYTIARRHVARAIDARIRQRRTEAAIDDQETLMKSDDTPETVFVRAAQQHVMKMALQGISDRDRNILTRFYLLGQSKERICGALNLSETQFRVSKSRAKAKFAELGRLYLATGGQAQC